MKSANFVCITARITNKCHFVFRSAFVAIAVLITAPAILAAPLDLNGDRKSDILYRDTATGAVGALLMNGTVPGAAATVLSAGSGWSVTHLADFNGDGKVDLLVSHTDGRIAVLLMNGTAVQSSTLLTLAGSGHTATVTGDFNGDGKADIVLRHADGAFFVLLMDSATVLSANFVLASASPWAVTHAGDFNGDGKTDLVIRHNDGSVAILIMNGTGATSAGLLLSAGSPWTITQLADFSGDGKADMVIANTDGSSAILVMNGTTVLSAAFLTGAGSPYTVTHTGDFNGDGKADVVIRHTDGSAVILLMNGTVATSASYLLTAGSTAAVVQVADYNGDGKSDILLRNADGSAVVVLMNGSVVTAFGNAWSAGTRAALPEPAGTTRPIASSVSADAARFLTQATFGPNMTAIDEVVAKGYARWIDDQFALPLHNPSHWKYVVIDKGPKGDSRYINSTMESFWLQAVRGQDQLRQRAVFALSQLFVVSTVNSPVDIQEDAHASYLDMLSRNAFGNFRTLLEEVSLHPTMAIYLTWFKNEKEVPGGRQPDENYAREVMQLFTIGLWQLNLDGTRKLDSSGKPIPTYTQADIKGMARVFTGWNWGQDGATRDYTNWYPPTRWDLLLDPYPDFHSTSEKRIINGVVIPANTNARDSMRVALDTLFNHPNVGPFIGSQLIKRFVTSNPSPAYVARVASAFNNNGAGVRGDMKAVLRAVLLDTEARSATLAAGSTFGKLREPDIRFANFMRAFDVKTLNPIVYRIWNLEDPVESLGQNPLRAPSVFNWYRPDYAPPGAILAGGLVAPEFQITHETTATGYTNFVTNTAYAQSESARADMAQYGPIDEYLAASFSAELALADQPDALIDRLNLLLLYGQMTPSLRNKVRQAINNVALDGFRGRDYRVAVAIALIMASPQYVVQK